MNAPRLTVDRSKAAQRFKLSPLAAACAAALLAVSAQAQQAAPAASDATQTEAAKKEADKKKVVKADPQTVDTVVVSGIRYAIESSIEKKREFNNIVEAVSSEDIGKLPDVSIAESLARLPGLTGERSADGGRVNVVSIRGLPAAFSGALLNGREFVSSNDSRAVEYDQFPSELIGSAVVYKTPDATLIGQGLSGTVDLHTLRPLEINGRQFAVNLRGQRNSNGDQVPGIAPKTGSRFSFSYIDQYLNNTVGLAVGYARLDVASQLREVETAVYGDFHNCCGIPIANLPVYGNNAGAALPYFTWIKSNSQRNTREGTLVVLENKPSKDFHSQLDIYYSRFETQEAAGRFGQSLFQAWSGYNIGLTNPQTTTVGQNQYITNTRIDDLPVLLGNTRNSRYDQIKSLGWNGELKFANDWTGTADLSYSRDDRHEAYYEAYAYPSLSRSETHIPGSFILNSSPDRGAYPRYTPVNPTFLSDPNIIRIGDGFNFVDDDKEWTGTLRTPVQSDTIKTARLTAKQGLEGTLLGSTFSNFQVGANFTSRDKLIAKNETRLDFARDAQGNPINDIPSYGILNPINVGWAGIPSYIRLDVPSLVNGGFLTPHSVFSFKPDNDSNVHERVGTLYAKLDIDTTWGGVPIRGNLGIQGVQTRQNSEGFEYRGATEPADITKLVRRTGGSKYYDVLPSFNLVAEIVPDVVLRLGLAKTLSRPDILQLGAGRSTPTLINDATAPGQQANPLNGSWNPAFGGNPTLKPWRANTIDFSVERYFGKSSYVSLAAFRKNLVSYVVQGQFLQDNSDLPVPVLKDPRTVVQRYGVVNGPVNGSGGYIEGYELTGSFEWSLLSPVLKGLGISGSVSKLHSSISEPQASATYGSNRAEVVNNSIPGLSGNSNNVSFYYEGYGFSARISERFRSAFNRTDIDVYGKNVYRSEASDKVVDLQLGYDFPADVCKGLSILFQVYNLKDRPTVTLNSTTLTPEAQLVPRFTRYFGRDVIFGVNYKF